ncbi:MAG: HAD family hydrolase [Anaerolineae bacterium]
MPRFDALAFDADDTLWHSESNYTSTKELFVDIVRPYVDRETALAHLERTEIGNLTTYGYGTKAFILSMIEAAVALSQGEVSAAGIQRLLDAARAMLGTDVDLLKHVRPTLNRLNGNYRMIVITKGDASEQAPKFARSGISHYFEHLEVVGEKTAEIYAALLRKYHVVPERFIMVGNSLRSDILPVLKLGGYGVYVPYEMTWSHEIVDEPSDMGERYYKLTHLGQLPDLLEQLGWPDGTERSQP